MTHTLSNQKLRVSILNKGAEISEITSIENNKNYLWDGNPEIWGSYAPVLFPIIGSLKNNTCEINNRQYNIPKHGIIRHNKNLKVIEKQKTKLTLELCYSEETLLIYPFKFKFVIMFELNENTLLVSHIVENLDSADIFFHLGGHPAFKCPFNSNERYEDYWVEFDHIENSSVTTLTQDGLISDQTIHMLNNTTQLHLDGKMFNQDALIFKNLKSRRVTLKCSNHNESIIVDYKDFPVLALWAKPKAPFICIEPWIGCADHKHTNGIFKSKDNLIKLPKNEIFKASYSITLNI